MTGPALCAIPGCRTRGRHLPGCDDDDCRGCLPRLAEDGLICDAHIRWAGEHLAEIAEMAPAARDAAHGLSATQSGSGPSGKPGSRLPLDLTATAKCDGVANALGGWVRHVIEERGLYPPYLPHGYDVIGPSARYLAEHLPWFRHRPEVDEFLGDVEAAVRILRGIARGPAAQRYLGPCGAPYLCDGIAIGDQGQPWAECGATESHEPHQLSTCEGDVYGPDGGRTGRCRTCKTEYPQAERRAWLDSEVRQHTYTAAEIGAAYPIKANTIRQWLSRGLLVAHGEYQGRPLLNLGEVLDLAAADAARREQARAERERRRQTAEMGA